MNGIFVGIDKPVGMTSHDVVQRVRRVTQIKKVGHAGTLDPNASGVLVIAIGREATRDISKVVAKEKEYIAGILLDRVSDTDDVMGKMDIVDVVAIPTLEIIEQTLLSYEGVIEQVPPVYSAVKVRGQEAYKRSRRGEVLIMKPRQVRVDEIEILDFSWPEMTLKIQTGPGVYIRSIARDLGRDLHTGGCLKSLRRTRVGEWKVEDCVNFDNLEEWWERINEITPIQLIHTPGV